MKKASSLSKRLVKLMKRYNCTAKEAEVILKKEQKQ